MNAQSTRSNSIQRRLAPGQALQLGRLGGDLFVVDGRVWLTRDGDLGDHVIEPGQKLRLAVNANAVIESVRTGDTVTVRWYPRRRSFAGALLAEPLCAVAFLMGRVANGLAALARRAAAGASRAEGCIRGSDAIGTSIALK